MADNNGRTVIVTGASRGLGAATAAAFARNGDTVFANYPDADAGLHRQAIDTWREGEGITSDRVVAVAADVSQVDRVSAMLETVQHHAGRVDVLVNNAGIARDRTVAKMTDDEWHAVMQVNLDGTFYCCRGVAAPSPRDAPG